MTKITRGQLFKTIAGAVVGTAAAKAVTTESNPLLGPPQPRDSINEVQVYSYLTDVFGSRGLVEKHSGAFPNVGFQLWYRGHRLIWTGWKEASHYYGRVAQWVAFDPDWNIKYYSSCPGFAGPTHTYGAFNVAVQPDYPEQLVCFAPYNLSRAIDAEIKTLGRLLDYMDRCIPG